MTKQKKIIPIIISIVISCFLFYLIKRINVSTGPFPMDWSVSLPTDDTSFGGLFAQPQINDSLPHYEYKKIEDSLQRIKNAAEFENNSNPEGGQSIGSFGVYNIRKDIGKRFKNPVEINPEFRTTIDSLDQLYLKLAKLKNQDSAKALQKEIDETRWLSTKKLNANSLKEEIPAEKLYFIGVGGYSTDYDTKFFIQNGTYNLAYVVWDSVKKRTYDSTKTGHYERKQIDVRYSEKDKIVLIPISKKSYNILNTLLNIAFFLLIFYSILVLLILPFLLLVAISRGHAFTAGNIKALKIISFSLFLFTLIKLCAPYIIRFFFRKKIPAEMELTPFTQLVSNNMSLIFSFIAVFLLMKAFKKGYKLQQEQDLTV